LTAELAGRLTHNKILHSLPYTSFIKAAGVISVIGLVKVAQDPAFYGVENTPEMKGKLMQLHKSIALLLMGGITLRIGARLTSKTPPPLPGNKLEHFAGAASHNAFYGFLYGAQ
jgi:cytochrome b561